MAERIHAAASGTAMKYPRTDFPGPAKTVFSMPTPSSTSSTPSCRTEDQLRKSLYLRAAIPVTGFHLLETMLLFFPTREPKDRITNDLPERRINYRHTVV
jgi:hypothetical protein